MQIKNTNEFDDILFNVLGFEMQISEAQKAQHRTCSRMMNKAVRSN